MEEIKPIKGGFNVTFWIESCLNGHGKYCIVCKTEDEARNAASDVYAFHGCKYIRFNRCGKVGKDVKVISYKRYQENYGWM